MRPLIALTTLLSCCASTIFAQDNWSRFRGPNGTGIAPAINVPNEWSSDDYEWSINLPGKGHSSPVVWNDVVVVTAAEGDKLSVCCHDVTTGDLRFHSWINCPRGTMHADNSTAATTPAIDSQHIYVTWATDDAVYIGALDYTTGAIVNFAWQAKLPAFTGQHGFCSSPAVIGDLVCLNVDTSSGGFIVAFDKATGEERWRVERGDSGKETYSTPCTITAEGKPLIIAESTGGGLQAISPTDGSIAWTLSDVLPARTVSSPCVAGDLVLATCGSGNSGQILVAAKCGASDASVEFTLDSNVPYVPTIIAKDDLLFLWHDQGIVTCIDRNSHDVVWRKRVEGKCYASPVCIGDRLINITRDGEAVMLAAGRDYKLLGRVDLGEPSHATAAVANGKLLLRTESKLFCLGAGSDK